MSDPGRQPDPAGSTEGMFTGQAAKGGPIGDPFDFHSEPHLRIFPQYYACEASEAIYHLYFLEFSIAFTVCLLGQDEGKLGDEDGKQYTFRFKVRLLFSHFYPRGVGLFQQGQYEHIGAP
jgi:hypothetical protein